MALLVTTIPGVFTIDEPNYLATLVSLRHGRLSLPGTEGLPPSQELAWFDPSSRGHGVTTPIVSFAPPLWAPIALPFSLVGLRGLFAINTLAYLATALVVFLYARRHARRPRTPWVAAGVFLFGTYSLEYAQAIWPHMLAVVLCTAAFYLASRVRAGATLGLAGAAGLCAGLAAGVRYQDFFFAGLTGLTLLLLGGRRRIAAALAYGCGVALPLGASSIFNQLRFGSWNPISKGPEYFKMTAGAAAEEPVFDTFAVFWARVVDYSTRPAREFWDFAFEPHPESGAHVFIGAVKKAWLQSSPWLAVVLVALLVAWLGRRREDDDGQRAELRAIALVVWPTLALFSVAGFGRTDGLCFNQRYFMELLPLAAVALAWVVERWRLERLPLLLGVLAAAVGAFWALVVPATTAFRHLALLRVPLVLAALLLVAWAALGWAPARRWAAALASLALGACLSWSAIVHLADDLPASRQARRAAARYTEALDRALPPRAVVFAWSGVRNTVAPLMLNRDLVVLDAGRDDGETARQLSEIFLARGERVFVVAAGFPAELLDELRQGRAVSSLSARGVYMFEVAERAGGR